MSKKTRRDTEDITRDAKIYTYLLHISGTKNNPQNLNINTLEADIAKIWDQTANRTFVRRVINNLYPGLAKNKMSEQDALPALSLNKLVKILTAIEEYWKKDAKNFRANDSQSIPEFLKDADKLRAIRKYCELSRAERKELKLPVDFDTYVKDNFISDVITENKSNTSNIPSNIPKYIEKEDNNGKTKIINEAYIDNLIQSVIEQELQIEWENRNNTILEIKEKVKNEIKAIEMQSGLQSVKYMRPIIVNSNANLFDEAFIKKWESCLPDELIQRLTKFFVDNVRLSNEFPIYFKYIEVEKVRTLPLYVKTEYNSVGLLNKELWKLDERNSKVVGEGINEFINALGGRHACRVRVHFCLKFDEHKHKDLLNKYKHKLDKNFVKELHFFEEVSGASSIISLVRKALNRAVLWDLPSLKQYFPVAQEVYIAPEGKLYGNDTLATVWSASRVRLVELEDVKSLLNLEKSNDNKNGSSLIDFDSYINGSDIFQGDYICFDMVEAIAVSGFYARLKTVREIGVDAQIYLEELCDRVIAQKSLIKGKKRLWSYPFSLRVMESYLQNTILSKKPKNSNEPWSNLAYEAQLHITQGYIEEGLTKAANTLLEELEPHIKYFSHLTRSNYYLCKATCEFLSEDERERAISKCESFLDEASKELEERSLKFFRIGEFSQANLSPSFSYWARIYALKARISVFFPLFIQESVNDLIYPISLLEKARISAARDGNSDYYAKATLSQSWCYLMQAYIGKIREGEFEQSNCIEWARRLIDHALLCYSETSQKAYQDYLKDVVFYNNEQDIDRMERFGDIIVPSPPLLHPVFNMTSGHEHNERTNHEETAFNKSNMVINIDSFLIKIHCSSTGKVVDLFGQHSSSYFFSCGMLKLCDNYFNASDDEIIERIKEANKFFVCCWAIAEGGAYLNEETNTIERNFKKLPSDNYGVSTIRGLYLHRISEIADLGKVFTVVCKCIISKFQPFHNQNWDDIIGEIFPHEKGVISKIRDEQLEYAKKQKHYNTHLKRHFEHIVEYLRSCESKTFESVQSCRKEILIGTFRRLRGE